MVKMYSDPDVLLGRIIKTLPMGKWPGGPASITAVYPDPAAPEIVMTVHHEVHGTIGVFWDEDVFFLGTLPTGECLMGVVCE
jgi:hypothetical protein